MDTTITQEQIQYLQSLGYTVEDMGKEHGEDFQGQYRWICGDDFQDGCTSFSENGAWRSAAAHHAWVRSNASTQG